MLSKHFCSMGILGVCENQFMNNLKCITMKIVAYKCEAMAHNVFDHEIKGYNKGQDSLTLVADGRINLTKTYGF